MGNGENGQFTFLDIISIMSFLIGVMNLDENISQSDMQDLQHQLADRTEDILYEMHGHLEEQDRKIDRILEVLHERDIH